MALTVDRFKGAWAVFDGDVVLHRAQDEEEAQRMCEALSAKGVRASGARLDPRPGIDTPQGSLLRMPTPAPREPAPSASEKPKTAQTDAKRSPKRPGKKKRSRSAGF